jgi:hypothetical protein
MAKTKNKMTFMLIFDSLSAACEFIHAGRNNRRALHRMVKHQSSIISGAMLFGFCALQYALLL